MPGIDLKAWRVFVTVADFGSLSQAALSLGLTQSSLSRIVAATEREAGGALFHRTGRGVKLTPLGDSVIVRARRMVAESEGLLADLRTNGVSPGGQVTVAMLPSIMREVAGPLFAAVKKSHPRITLRILEAFSGQIAAWLADGRVDIGVVTRYRRSHARTDLVMGTTTLALVSAARGAKPRETIRFRELDGLPLVLPARPNGMRMALDAVASRLRFELRVEAEADSIDAQKSIVLHGGCHAILSPHNVWRDPGHAQFVVRTIVEPKVPRLIAITTSQHHPLGEAARAVLAHLQRIDFNVREP